MTEQEQIDEALLYLDDEQVDIKNLEEDELNKLLMFVIAYLVKNKLKSYKNKKLFLKKLNEKMIIKDRIITEKYLEVYGLSKEEKILGYTVSKMITSISKKELIMVSRKIYKNKDDYIDVEIITPLLENKGKLKTVKETLNAKLLTDKKINETSEKGWKSIAVLDSKTTEICKSLSDKIYLASEYKTRGDIPNQPPRHFNCRSILINLDK